MRSWAGPRLWERSCAAPAVQQFFGPMKQLAHWFRKPFDEIRRLPQRIGEFADLWDLGPIRVMASAAALVYASALALMYGVWLCAWHEIGYAPRYGHPRSYTVGPIADHRFLYWPFAMYLLWLSAPFVAMGCLAIVPLVLVRRKRRTKDDWISLAAAASTLVLIWFFVSDRYDVLDWYCD
jgi:hypothetical protein